MEFLKEIFGDKSLSYAELETALKDSKTVKIGNLAGGAYVGKDKFDAEHTRAEGLAQQLTAANTKLSGYDPDWKQKSDAATAEVDKQVNAIKFDYALSDALRASKARDVTAVKAHLRIDGLKLDGDKIIGLSEQLEPLKKERGYLFEEAQKPPRVISSTPGSQTIADETKKAQANSALKSLFGRKE